MYIPLYVHTLIYNYVHTIIYVHSLIYKGILLATGCKTARVNVVYTPFPNLKKTANMDVGQVGFYKQKEVCTR